MPEHGGRLNAAAAHYGYAPAQWLDLSTGVNPNGWPVPPLPGNAWNRLPEPDDGLLAAARTYYAAAHVLPVAGSQAAILAIPTLRARGRVGILAPGYSEHASAWRHAGHDVELLANRDIAASLSRLDVLVLANPNNPTGCRFAAAELLRWHDSLAAKDGWLVVDEAFMDAAESESLAALSTRPGLIVLRSLGKFFGLAGARVGFVLSEDGFLQRLDEKLGSWTVNGPARVVAALALQDHAWQRRTRTRLTRDTQRLQQLLCAGGLPPAGGTALFQWVLTPQAAAIHDRLARQGVLVRLFAEPASLRFGLPASEAEWQRLRVALAASVENTEIVA
ncbi:MAG: threonine-phosphate decarboxylase CobD [Acidiferrobacterales bacterium]